MDILTQKTTPALVQSVVAEIAKASNEIRCSRADLAKATSRLSFALAVLNEIRSRYKDEQDEAQ